MILNHFDSTPGPHLTPPIGDAIDVWGLRFDSSWRPMEELQSSLTPGELVRAERFAIDKPRRQFIVARGSLRHLLKCYLGCEPDIRDSNRGKPGLESGNLHFNVSHSGNVGVIAVANRRVGIDVEELRPMPNAAGLVERFFSREEQEQYAALPPEQKHAAFFRGWTGKEALLKAVGVGLADLESCVVDLDPRQPPRVVRFYHPPEPGTQWSVATWTVTEGYVASLAFEVIC